MKPTPSFSITDLEALLQELQQERVEEERDWFTLRDVVAATGRSRTWAQQALRRLKLEGRLVYVGRKLMQNELDDHYSHVPAYRIVGAKEE